MTNEVINSSFEYCENIAKQHYENFPVASKLLPPEKRKYIFAIYAYARQADDYADEPGIGTREERLRLIDDWNDKLRNTYRGLADEPIFIALSQTIKDCGIPVEPLDNLLKAFRQDVIKNRYENIDEVFSYCANSANPIGRLVLNVFGYSNESLFYYSDKICTALQLTNFWQDIKIDLFKDRIYLPQTDMLRFGYSVEDLLQNNYDIKFKELMKFEVLRTEELFNEGNKLLELISHESSSNSLKSELSLILSGGRLILKKIKGIGFDVFNKRPVITKLDKLRLFSKYKFS